MMMAILEQRSMFISCFMTILVLMSSTSTASISFTSVTPSSSSTISSSPSTTQSESAAASRSESFSSSSTSSFSSTSSTSFKESMTVKLSSTTSLSEQRRTSTMSRSPTATWSNSPSSNPSPSFTASPSWSESMSVKDTRTESYTRNTTLTRSTSLTYTRSKNRRRHLRRVGVAMVVISATVTLSSDSTQSKSPSATQGARFGWRTASLTKEYTATETPSSDPPTATRSRSPPLSASDSMTINRGGSISMRVSTTITVSASSTRQRRHVSKSKSPTNERSATNTLSKTPTPSGPSASPEASRTITITQTNPSRTPSSTVTFTVSTSWSQEPSQSRSVTPSITKLSPSSSNSDSPMVTSTPTLRPTTTTTITPPPRVTPSDTSSLTNDITVTAKTYSKTSSRTLSRSISASETAEITSTNSESVTVSVTQTITPPPTPTHTRTSTSSKTVSQNSPTEERSNEVSATASATSTITPPPTPSPTSSPTSSQSFDGTRSNTITPPPTPTPTSSPSEDASVSPSLTDSPTVPTKSRPLTVSPSREISQVMINDTYTVRLSGNGWAEALQKDYNRVFLAARYFIALAVDVPEWQVTIHTLRSGSLVIFFSLDQFQPRYKNITLVQQLLLRGSTANAQSALQSILNTTTPESVEPLGVVSQNGQPLVMPSSCDSTCVALIVSCIVGSAGLIAIGVLILVKLKLYLPLDYDFEAEAARKEEARRAAEESARIAAENRVSHVHEGGDDDDVWDERRRWENESKLGSSGVQRDVIQVRSIDPKHYHLETSLKHNNNDSSSQQDGEGVDASVFSSPAQHRVNSSSSYSHPYLIYGHNTGADATPHALSDDAGEKVELKPFTMSPDAVGKADASSSSIEPQEKEKLSPRGGKRAASYRSKGDSPIMVDRSASNTPQQSAQNSPRRKTATTFTVVNPRMPDPTMVSRIKRPASDMVAELVSSRTSQAKLSVTVGSLPTSPAPPLAITHQAPSTTNPPEAPELDHRSGMPRTTTTTHTVARWSVPLVGPAHRSTATSARPSTVQAPQQSIISPRRPSSLQPPQQQPEEHSRNYHPPPPQTGHRNNNRSRDPFQDIPMVSETDFATPRPSPRPPPSNKLAVQPPLNRTAGAAQSPPLSARQVTYYVDDVAADAATRFDEDDAAFVDIVEVGSAMEDDVDA